VAAFDPAEGTQLWSHSTAGTQHDRALALPGGIVVTEDSELGAAVVRAARDGDVRHRLEVGSGELSQLVGAGATVAAATEGGDVLVFDAVSGEGGGRKDRLGGDVRALSLDDEGSLLAAALSGGEVRVWSLTSGTLRTAFVVPGGEVTALRFSPESDALWTGSEDGGARLWHPLQRPETSAVDVYAGTRTNLRVCRDDLRPVPVVPFPPSESVWAADEVCD
jgi:WD40 repeat protein